MDTLVPCVGTSPRCNGPVSGPSLPPPPAQTSLVSDRVKGPLTKIILDVVYQEYPTFQKFIVCLQATDCFLLLSGREEGTSGIIHSQKVHPRGAFSPWWGPCCWEEQGPMMQHGHHETPPGSIPKILEWCHTWNCFWKALACFAPTGQVDTLPRRSILVPAPGQSFTVTSRGSQPVPGRHSMLRR